MFYAVLSTADCGKCRKLKILYIAYSGECCSLQLNVGIGIVVRKTNLLCVLKFTFIIVTHNGKQFSG